MTDRDLAPPTSSTSVPVAEQPAETAETAGESDDVTGRLEEREVQRARTPDDVRVHTAAVEALTERWGATFAPDAVDDAVAAREELWSALIDAAEDGVIDDSPATADDAEGLDLPETVGELEVVGTMPDGHRLTVHVGSIVEPTADLAWVERWVEDSLHEPVPVADDDVQVWSYGWPVDDRTGLGGQVIDVFTTRGIVSISYDHVGDAPTVRPEDAVPVARAVFDLP